MPKHPFDKAHPAPDESPSGEALKISRRSFGRRAATVAALSLSPGTLLGTARDPRPELAAGTGSQSQTKAEDNSKLGITPGQAADVEAKLANIIRKFGSRLSGAQREHLRRILSYNERMLAGVRAFSLQNGDPPASVLKVSFARETAAPGTRPAVAGTLPDHLGEAERGGD